MLEVKSLIKWGILKLFLKWSLLGCLHYNALKSFKFFPLIISDNIPFGAYGNPKKITRYWHIHKANYGYVPVPTIKDTTW